MRFDHVVLKPSEQIGEHSQSGWELDYILKGHGIRKIGTDVQQFVEGDMVLVHPDMKHFWKFDDDTSTIENIAIFWDTPYLRKTRALFPEFEQIVNDFESIQESLEIRGRAKNQISEFMVGMECQSDAERVISFLSIINILSKKTGIAIAGHQASGKSSQDRVKEIETYVSCNYNRELPLSKIASIAGMNETSFCSFWKRETGKTYKSYLIEYRINVAKYLLSLPDKRICEICYECGFGDIPHFCRSFKKLTGISPRQYRLSLTNSMSR